MAPAEASATTPWRRPAARMQALTPCTRLPVHPQRNGSCRTSSRRLEVQPARDQVGVGRVPQGVGDGTGWAWTSWTNPAGQPTATISAGLLTNSQYRPAGRSSAAYSFSG